MLTCSVFLQAVAAFCRDVISCAELIDSRPQMGQRETSREEGKGKKSLGICEVGGGAGRDGGGGVGRGGGERGRGHSETDGQDVLFPEHIRINERRRHSLTHSLASRWRGRNRREQRDVATLPRV